MGPEFLLSDKFVETSQKLTNLLADKKKVQARYDEAKAKCHELFKKLEGDMEALNVQAASAWAEFENFKHEVGTNSGDG